MYDFIWEEYNEEYGDYIHPLKEAFDNNQDNFVVLGVRSYTVSNGNRSIRNYANIFSDKIQANTFQITSSVTSDNYYFAGGCMASELSFTLMNNDGLYNANTFNIKGYEIYAYMGSYRIWNNITTEDNYKYYVVDKVSEAYTHWNANNVGGKPLKYVLNTKDGNNAKGLTFEVRSDNAKTDIGELLPMGVFIVDDVKYIEQGRRLQIKALDRMTLFDGNYSTRFINLDSSRYNASIAYKSMQFARVIEQLCNILYGTSFDSGCFSDSTKNIAGAQPRFCKLPWSYCGKVCDDVNKIGNNHAAGNLLYIYDNDTDFAMYQVPNETRYYASYSWYDNYLPAGKKNTTYRNVLQAICEILGCNAWFNRNGLLEFDWLSSNIKRSDYTAGSSTWVKRFSDSYISINKIKDINLLTPKAISMSGAIFYANTDGSSDTYYKANVGTGYIKDISNNKLVGSKTCDTLHGTNDQTETEGNHGQYCARFFFRNRMQSNSVHVFSAFTYQPFEMQYANTPYIDLCDKVNIITQIAGGGTYSFSSYVTDITYNTNVFMKIKARGEEIED